jgi:hypothetical protein
MTPELENIFGAIARIVKEKMPDSTSTPENVGLKLNAEFQVDNKGYKTVFNFDKDKNEFVSNGDIEPLFDETDTETETETPKDETKEVEAEVEKTDEAMDSSTESDVADVKSEKADTDKGLSLAELYKTVKDLQAQIEELKSCMPASTKGESDVLNEAEDLVESKKGDNSETPNDDLPESKKANVGNNAWLNDTFGDTF